MPYRPTMMRGRSLATSAILVTISVAAACSAPVARSPSPAPSITASSESPSPRASASPRPLASFAADADWRPILELAGGSGGRDEGSFDGGARFRIRYDCVGDGSISVSVGGRVQAQRECSLPGIAEPKFVREQAGNRLRASVTARGEVEWIVRLEVPR